ncbi:phosphoribosylformylglycinamidine synthase subunit II [Desulfobotulus alkaliphilus]|uniref:Phosphoribosylformylglycinamidine synthase subunit PurL n=1 Tax=Desulfobotulus alkaliphilus TaxID=622671 RepID=A0A562S7L4_9BACT|nr:AIR synthase-related protein [Desulfobotulus alkaliphilus]TWI77421.1 phosphoribosylformylglycinamidine synthase subunit II [Desulfobotulus alkaliphilus]
MQARLEITLKPELEDAEGLALQKKVKDVFGIELDAVRCVRILTFDAELTEAECILARDRIFCNPVSQEASFEPLALDFDGCIWVGFRPGVRDNAGATAMEALSDVLGRSFGPEDTVYTSRRYCIKGKGLTEKLMDRIAGELLANDIIQQWQVFTKESWDVKEGVGLILPKVRLNHEPEVTTIPIDSDATLQAVSQARNLALNPNDVPVIRRYFLNGQTLALRREKGLEQPTDIEIEYIAQGRSDHCNHNTFRGLFRYRDLETGETEVIDNLFKTCIQNPTLKMQKEKDWVVSVLWDNAGAARFDDHWNYVITGETHNSPSNMEAYGGAITGIVGVYRDPLGTGKGARLIMGSYGFCVGELDYDGPLKPRLHPRRILDGVVEGVRDGGNKSGVPTPFGQVTFHSGYMGKCLVFVTALGIMPKAVAGAPGHEKTTSPGEHIIMCGGRVGKDGIHGVTASSETFSAHTPAGHVQIGDPYTQKKMHDFLLEARDAGLIAFITDNGGGGLSSSIGESARFAGGCTVALDQVPLKYEGLDQWEIWVSESQERMTVSVKPEHLEAFMALSEKHAVESTVIGTYTDTGYLEITWKGKTVAWIHMDLLEEGFPQWEFDCEWIPPKLRGLYEPVIGAPSDYNGVLKTLLARPNIASKEWIVRQYDHEVQANSVIKPLVGRERDIPSDAAVIRPVLDSERGIAFTQTLLPTYSQIDAGAMTAAVIDEAVRRLLAVGGGLSEMGGVDNFCWPDIQYHPEKNPDGRFKAAQLVRSCKALQAMCEAYQIPLLSGKDSMYVDGHLQGPFGETRKVSGLETLQFSATAMVENVWLCQSMDVKNPGDRLYLLGETANELGGSEYYEWMGYVGLHVPEVDPEAFLPLYQALEKAMKMALVNSAHAVARGGLGVHLALVAMAGCRGLNVDLGPVKIRGDIPVEREDILLFSESCGRMLVTVSREKEKAFQELFDGLPCACIGEVLENDILRICGRQGKELVHTCMADLKQSFKKPFGDRI